MSGGISDVGAERISVVGAPAPGVQRDNFSVRWTGQIQVPVTGTCRFATTAANDAAVADSPDARNEVHARRMPTS